MSVADQIPDSAKLEVTRTSRGFAVARGVDRYAAPYSIQDSSLAEKAAIWLGSDADTGGRAHLTKGMAAGLIPLLQAFVATGSIAGPADTIAAPPAMDREAVHIAREELGEPQEWIDRLEDLYGWTGSAWLAGETKEQPEGLQAFLTSLIGFLLSGRDAAKALSTLSADAIRQGEGSLRDEIRNEIINTPETADFMAGVPLEAAHQRERWGVSHDGGKTPFDWFWLIGYLAQKAASAQVAGDMEKALHHTISTAAALANWHAQISGRTDMRPGIGPDNGGRKDGSAYALASALATPASHASDGGKA